MEFVKAVMTWVDICADHESCSACPIWDYCIHHQRPLQGIDLDVTAEFEKKLEAEYVKRY